MRKGREKILCISLILQLSLLLSLVTTFIIPVSATPTTIYVDPQSIIDQTLTPPKTFTINVTLFNVTNLYGFEFKLGYDTTILDISKVTVQPFLNEPTLTIKNEVREDLGRYWLGISSLSPAPAKNGSGTLATITFKVTGIGHCALDLYETKLIDNKAASIPHSIGDGYFDNRPPSPPALIFVNPPRIVNLTKVPCENFAINVSIINATYLYSFEFKLSFDPTILTATDAVLGGIFPPVPPTVEINNTAGYILFSASLAPPQLEISGSGTLAVITFHVESLGASRLTLHDIVLADKFGGLRPYRTSDGYFNNVLLAKIFVDPPSITDPTLLPPATFNINISIANVTDMYDYVFKLGYNTKILNCLSVKIIPFNNEIHFTSIMSISDAAGIIYVNVTYFDPAVPITTTSPVAFVTIKFQLTGLGSTVLDLYDTRLSDPAGALIPHEATDGLLRIIAHDVAILSVEPSTTATYAGRLVNITVVAENEGDMTETFNVSAYYDNNLIGTQTVTDLLSGANKTLIFTWNTAGLQPCKNYTIKAEASVVPYETNMTNNLCVDGKVKIKMLGDVNGDGIIDIVDVGIVATAFGSATQDDPRTLWNEILNWNPDADLNGDLKVDIGDIVTVAIHFGEKC